MHNVNMDNKLSREYVKLHVSVLLAGLTGILGKLITLNALFLVWYRLFFSFIIFYGILFFLKKLPRENISDILKISGLGMLLGLHFLFFFASIKFANVAVGVVCYSLEGFFTAILEPLILKKSVSKSNILCSLIAVAGISLIFHIDTHFRFGIILGVISAVLIALYTLLNKAFVDNKSVRVMLYYELFGAVVLVSLIMCGRGLLNGVNFVIPSCPDFCYLFVLAFFCTLGLYILQIQVLRTLSAFTVSLYGNFEPVYGILLAVIFLGEGSQLTISFYIGMSLILFSVFLQSFVQSRKCDTKNFSDEQLNIISMKEKYF